ncbi:hypothetical protein T459_00017 [Capsicum annuum]|uniref:Uncharacterized protein n=2 Tax=Capsicum TaxID=4071 RepID=A0A2G3AD30_CAPAN|nr:hypothetical protein T459_00017 [Capsicum annuum]
MLAASTVAISSTSYAADPHLTFPSPSTKGLGYSSSMEKLRSDKSRKLPLTASEKEKFTPKFDGLRFIETLVTAHR